ncbi:phasin family protein [Halomonas sp. McH1-25]|uniref:phasin family protein n=1 Tax=unclassified Halomonas TaxID=2609666 RepID=UPI001EF5118D|nr:MULTISPECIES: phasin family protein [unclassified Halomonas]MCG7599215.1 phasin family protein [Halomonas sp. McH1-25]MCP1341083.1 phasin family protein [Halomonas sp. FL8]MCP1361697.1 phasin family protein [Halomonas sp. BBD45]MCP1364579.1 phasin family protein [Halomonas sp. BBD48]
MATKDFDKTTQQFESLFFGPARAYASLAVDYTEQLVNTQLEFTKSYAEASLGQMRAFMNVRDPEGFRSYVEGQQKVAKDMGDMLKVDAEKVVALNRDFMQKSQKLVEDNVKSASKAANQ